MSGGTFEASRLFRAGWRQDVNLKVMSMLPGFRYSSVAAPDPCDGLGERLAVDVSQQIPRKQAGVKLHSGLLKAARCGWICTRQRIQGRIR